MVWQKIVLLGLGGFIGSNLRYWVSLWAAEKFGPSLPYGTLIVNVLGSFLLALLLVYSSESQAIDPRIRLLIGTGLLGALTTFSTFSFETLELLRNASLDFALANILLNVALSLIAAYGGLMAAKGLRFIL